MGNELCVRNDWLGASFGDNGQVFQVFEKLLVIGNRKHHGSSLSVIVGQMLEGGLRKIRPGVRRL